ncbi:MAG: hypothetical protein ACI4QN_06770 [Candidatus Coproplasma sp.]
MNKHKTFLFIFLGVIVAGLLCLGAALIVRATVTGNAVVTIVTLFALIAGGIMAGIGLISLLICLLLMVFSKGDKRIAEQELAEEKPDENLSKEEK